MMSVPNGTTSSPMASMVSMASKIGCSGSLPPLPSSPTSCLHVMRQNGWGPPPGAAEMGFRHVNGSTAPHHHPHHQVSWSHKRSGNEHADVHYVDSCHETRLDWMQCSVTCSGSHVLLS